MKSVKPKAKSTAGRLPQFLALYVWDADISRVNARRHEYYLIERLIEYGDDRAIRWLRSSYSDAQIARVVQTSRVISPNTANLWSLVLKIPRGSIKCFSKRSLLQHSAFSHA